MKKLLVLATVAVAAMSVHAQESRVIEDGGTGPFKAIMTQDASLSTHTIIRPEDMSKFGKGNLIPVLLWGNGGCAKSCSGHVNFLSEVASQGFFIVAIGPMPAAGAAPQAGQTGGGMPQMGGGMPPMGGGMPPMGGPRPQGAPQGGQPGQGGQRPAMGGFPGGGMPPMGGGMPQMGGGMPQMGGGMSMGDPADLIKALEWVIAQNADKNSPYYGKLDLDNIAAAGMSCGGLEALHMSNDARVKTIMVMNSGFFNGGDDKASLNSMKTKSVIWILGGSTDIAWENGNDDFKQLDGTMPAFLCSLDGIGHGGTYMQPHGGDYAKVAGAWLKWQLKNDKEAGTMFTGSEPGVSKMEGWMFDRKNIK